MTKFQVRLELADGYTWVTVSITGGAAVHEWEKWMTAKLDDVLKLPNAIYDIPSLAHANDGEGLMAIYSMVDRAR